MFHNNDINENQILCGQNEIFLCHFAGMKIGSMALFLLVVWQSSCFYQHMWKATKWNWEKQNMAGKNGQKDSITISEIVQKLLVFLNFYCWLGWLSIGCIICQIQSIAIQLERCFWCPFHQFSMNNVHLCVVHVLIFRFRHSH